MSEMTDFSLMASTEHTSTKRNLFISAWMITYMNECSSSKDIYVIAVCLPAMSLLLVNFHATACNLTCETDVAIWFTQVSQRRPTVWKLAIRRISLRISVRPVVRQKGQGSPPKPTNFTLLSAVWYRWLDGCFENLTWKKTLSNAHKLIMKSTLINFQTIDVLPFLKYIYFLFIRWLPSFKSPFTFTTVNRVVRVVLPSGAVLMRSNDFKLKVISESVIQSKRKVTF